MSAKEGKKEDRFASRLPHGDATKTRPAILSDRTVIASFLAVAANVIPCSPVERDVASFREFILLARIERALGKDPQFRSKRERSRLHASSDIPSAYYYCTCVHVLTSLVADSSVNPHFGIMPSFHAAMGFTDT